MPANLLPNGLVDLLPETAEKEADAIHALMSFFKSCGYRRVKPPLIEFEETLLQGPGQATSKHMFRMMDPKSQKMMGLRADITPQIARIAATRYEKKDYPLRFSYAGDILHVKGTQLNPARQMTQVGCELIGDERIEADIECIMTALRGFYEIGLRTLTLDMTLPALLRDVLGENGHPELFKALEQKNLEQIEDLGGAYKELLLALVSMTGVIEQDMKTLEGIEIPERGKADLQRLQDVVKAVQSRLAEEGMEDVVLTIDPTEHSFFNYHRGISFTIYTRGVREAAGRGGRYDFETDSGMQSAIGFTIYMNGLRKVELNLDAS